MSTSFLEYCTLWNRSKLKLKTLIRTANILFQLFLWKGFLLLMAVSSFAPIKLDAQQKPVKCFTLPPLLREVSGLYIAGPNEFWWLNDGGGNAELYQTNARGKIVQTIPIPKAKNIDWEDLTTDMQGNIYIGDFGNNSNLRKDLRIYQFHLKTRQTHSFSFYYPDQSSWPPSRHSWNFDAEGFFWYNDSLYLFSKNILGYGNYYTKQYALSTGSDNQAAILRDSLYLKNRVVTAAAISPDGQTVALLSYTFKKIWGFWPYSAASIFLLRDFIGTDYFSGNVFRIKIPSFLFASQYESIDWLNNDTLYFASEQTKFIKPKAKRMQLKKRHFNKKKIWQKKAETKETSRVEN